jgi:hypothetical protein
VPILKTLSHILSRPAGHLVGGSVRDAVAEAMKEQDFPSRGEIDALQRALKAAEGRAETLAGRLEALEGRTAGILDELAAARADAAAAREDLTRLSVEPEPVVAATPTGCRVPGCAGEHRSRGFCSPHYQQWRRGTLRGFVASDGSVVDGDRRWKVDLNFAGLPFSVAGDTNAATVRVLGRVVPSQTL